MILNGVDFSSGLFFLERMFDLKISDRFRPGSPVSLTPPLLPVLFALLMLLAGCASASAGISTSNIPIGNREYEILGTGETTVSWWSIDAGLIGLPLERPPVDTAVQKLLQEKQGDALVNLRYSTDRSIFLFMTRHRFHLKADVVKFKAIAAPVPKPGRH